MAEKKSIGEEALLDIKIIQEALKANTKEILRSVAREEIDGLVKESLEEGDYTEEAIEDEAAPEEEGSEEESEESEEEPVEIGGEESDEEEDESPEVGPEDDQEMGMDADIAPMGGDDADMGDELDMTDASDDDVIAIYKKLSGDDEIEIVGDEIHLNISEPGEYIVKKGALGMDESMDETMDDTMEEGYDEMEEGYEENEGLTYEIAMDEESTMTEEEDESIVKEDEKSEEEDESMVKEEDEEEGKKMEEKISVNRVDQNRAGGNLTKIKGPGAKQGAKFQGVQSESVSSKKVVTEAEVKYKKLLNEATKLKAENEEFRQALKKFRSMLVETVVFNSNLSYVTKLFMEHSTTKVEKKKIIQRFDEEVTNLKESKKLYKTIVNELTARKPVNESIETKIIKEVATGSSKQLNEATAYVDPSTQRIKDLISRVENKDKY